MSKQHQQQWYPYPPQTSPYPGQQQDRKPKRTKKRKRPPQPSTKGTAWEDFKTFIAMLLFLVIGFILGGML